MHGHAGYTPKHTNVYISKPIPQQQKQPKQLPASTLDPGLFLGWGR